MAVPYVKQGSTPLTFRQGGSRLEVSAAEAADSQTSGWMRQVGSWNANPEAYPLGLEPVSDTARAAGLGLLLWAEPARVFEGTQLLREHPDWLIGPVASGNTNGLNFMVNLGNAEARRHITDLISALIRREGITCYRRGWPPGCR